jgi:hypothetical protein
VKQKENVLFLGMGDLDDLAAFSERRAIAQIMDSLHDDTVQTLNDIFVQRTQQLAKELSFMKGKLLGLIEGNHYGVLSSGITTTEYLAQLLGCKYLGCNSFIRLSFNRSTRVTACVDIWAHHGRGAARLTGGSLNSVEQMIMIADADIYLQGHDHRKSVAIRNKIVLAGNNPATISNKKVLMARTGSFLKGYVAGASSYIAKAQLTPTDLGVVTITLTPKRKVCRPMKMDTFYVDINASL